MWGKNKEKINLEIIDNFLRSILKIINDKIFFGFEPLEKIGSTKNLTTNLGKAANYFLKGRIKEKVKNINEEIDFTSSKTIEQLIVTSGFIGIGRYPKRVRNTLINLIPLGPWKTALFNLPPVGDSKILKIDHVDLQIGLLYHGELYNVQQFTWNPYKGWRDLNGKSRNSIFFPLGSLEQKFKDYNFKNLKFQKSFNIIQGNNVVKFTHTQDVVNGQIVIETPINSNYVEVVVIDGTKLFWKGINKNSELIKLNITLKSGAKAFRASLKPRIVNGDHFKPFPLYWLIPKIDSNNLTPITADIQFVYQDKPNRNWMHNGKNIRDILKNLEITLKEEDTK